MKSWLRRRGVTQWKIGDGVCALVAGGGYAEFCVVPEGSCLPKPEKLSWDQAGAAAEAFYGVDQCVGPERG